MINFLYNNETVRVRFTYRVGKKTGSAALRSIKNKKIVTEAEISVKNVAGEWRILSVGEAQRNRQDVFQKAMGREIALGRAVVQLDDTQLIEEIWRQYSNRGSANTNQSEVGQEN